MYTVYFYTYLYQPSILQRQGNEIANSLSESIHRVSNNFSCANLRAIFFFTNTRGIYENFSRGEYGIIDDKTKQIESRRKIVKRKERLAISTKTRQRRYPK